MKSNPKNPIIASFKELALKMNVLLSTVNRLLVRLQEENIIVREGNNRKGRWVIKTIMSMNITKPIIRKIKDNETALAEFEKDIKSNEAEDAKDIIMKYRSVLDACAELLLEKEKIGREEFEALFPSEETET